MYLMLIYIPKGDNMEYNWSNTDIEREIDKLLIMSKEEKDLVKRSYYLRIIDQMKSVFIDNKDVIIPNNQKMNEIIYSFKFYGRYYSLIDLYHLILDGYADQTTKLVRAYDSIDNPELFDYGYITHDDALTMNYDFFHNMDEEIFKYFEILYKDRYKSIKFSKDDPTLKQAKADGYCIFIDVVCKNFININDSIGLTKVVDLAHECGHAIANLLIRNIYDTRDDFLTEMASLFFQLAFHNDIGEKIDTFENTLLQFEQMNYFNYEANLLLYHSQLIESWQHNKYNVSPDFYRYLKNKYQLKRPDIKESLNISIGSKGIYIIGYMIALELLHIYKDNKKEALSILKQMLIKARFSDSLDIISQFMPCFPNINLEIQQLHDKMKQEFIKKKILN